jgi:6-phosphogluconolactonase
MFPRGGRSAGGKTPRSTYAALATLAADWSRWEILFGDERCVLPTHPWRNGKLATDAWLGRVPISPHRIHGIPAELGAAAAASAYAKVLRDIGEFDLVLLGLGEDGHTASLFPGHDWGSAPGAPDTLAVFYAPKPPPHRVSLSASRLGRSQAVLFLIEGESRRGVLTRWRENADIPAGSIKPTGGVDVLVEGGLLPTSASERS